ncbi:SDR family oxidoreductase [Klebsiella pneumoniae subsp. pneumoniae]|nr:SDR family oxidoreductase [Klebsiella pneumoniae subsp. pneumoniae]
MLGLTRLLANEWAGQSINVNAIAPGYMATNNTRRCAKMKSVTRRSSSAFPLVAGERRKDLQGPVVFLASSAADYINGYTLAVDGGWLAR